MKEQHPTQGARSAYTRAAEAPRAAAELAEQLSGMDPTAILFFSSHQHDGAHLSRELNRRFARAHVIGCTTAGEFTQGAHGVGTVSAIALEKTKVKRCASAVVRCGKDSVEAAVASAFDTLGQGFGCPPRELDPKHHVGVVLMEGLKMREEDINAALGNQAPLISFVGGSAGDNLEFKQTRVFCNGEECVDGAALLLLEMAAPFTVAKTCSFQSTGKSFQATKVDETTRTIYELNGRPVAHVYAEAAGVTPEKLDGALFMSQPWGLMIQGRPWIRSPQQLLPNGGLRFYCKVSEGMEIHLMRATNLVDDTRACIQDAERALGKEIAGGLMFNCILRRLELDAQKTHEPFLATMPFQAAGFHTYGESWLGHINQTLTALLIA